MVKLKKIDAFFKRKTLDKENGCSFQYFGKDLPPLKVIKVMKPMIKKMTIINHIIGWLRRRLLSWSLDWGNWDELFKIIMCLFLCQVSLGLVLRGVLWTLIREWVWENTRKRLFIPFLLILNVFVSIIQDEREPFFVIRLCWFVSYK